MDPLTFVIREEASCEDNPFLTPCSQNTVSDVMWEELADHFACEPTLLPYPASILAQRWREGYSAVVVFRRQIISHICLAPIVQHLPGSDSWSAITTDIDKANTELPNTDVYECRSSWTDSAWRGKKISPVLHSHLIQRWLKNNTLGLSGMLGHASPTLARLGWQNLAWEAFPFVNSLISVPGKEFSCQASWAWCLPRDLKLYQGSDHPLEHLPDSLEPFCWVSNPAIANRLNQELASLVDGNLQRWRRAIVSAFCTPQSSHKMVFIF